MRQKLSLHGFTCETVKEGKAGVEVEVFRVADVQYQPRSYEGRVQVKVKGAWAREVRDIPQGSLYVPAAQRGRALLVHLLDPAGPDSLLTWGLFHTALEEKEYLEDYVAEAAARQMLDSDPALKAEFHRKLAEEPEFAKSPTERLRFFKRRHPSWDDRYGLYPISRLAAPPR